MTDSKPETLDEFRRSFSYGSRTDLLFKFLDSEAFSDQDAGEFIRGLFAELGDAFDSGDLDRVRQYVFEWQVRGYSPQGLSGDSFFGFHYESTPWTPLAKPLSESRLTLISAGGLFVEGDDPLGPDGPSQEEAIAQIAEFLRSAPRISTIPRDTEAHRLRVRHPGYDIRGTSRDHNVVFPIDRLKELLDEGILGELAKENYSFVGATSQIRLRREAAPALARELKDKGVDAALLVAA